jgi:hypothetical protein
MYFTVWPLTICCIRWDSWDFINEVNSATFVYLSQERMYIIHLSLLFTFRCLANLRHFVLVSIVTYKKKKDLTTFYNNSFLVRRVHEWNQLEDSTVSSIPLNTIAFPRWLYPRIGYSSTYLIQIQNMTTPKNTIRLAT